MNRSHFLTAALAAASLVLVSCNHSETPEEFQKHLQEKLIKAKSGDVISLPEGKFHLDRTLSLTVNGVTIRGQGMSSVSRFPAELCPRPASAA